MQKTLRILVSATLLPLFLSACGKSDSSGDGNSSPDGGPVLRDPTTVGSVGDNTNPDAVGSETALTSDQSTAIRDRACNGVSLEPEASPAKLEVIVDVSSSMNDKAPGSSNSKWVETRQALIDALTGNGADNPGLAAATSVGLLFYPNLRVDPVSTTPTVLKACVKQDAEIPMAQLGGTTGAQRVLLRKALETANLGLGTPTNDAYDYALSSTLLGANKNVPGDAFMLLITDGMPTLLKGCYNPAGSLEDVDPQPIVKAIEAARAQGVRTFIIGSPGSEKGRDWLSQAAIVGGTAPEGCKTTGNKFCHMDMTAAPNFSTALRAGLSQVAASLGACKYEIPATSEAGDQKIDPNAVNPMITYGNGKTNLVGRDNANGEACTVGYRLLSDTQLQLCKTTCESFQADSKARMDLMFGCSPDVIDTIVQ